MPTKFENKLDAYQSNTYPAMYEVLGEQLGVSANSLRRLGIGWVPVVEFKKGMNFLGWWCIPERDAVGRVNGLGLRSLNGMKVMHPGSRHGLIYEVNPEHEHGAKGYEAGPHNWVRTMDAGRVCPVCGKPDGCLLSSENPNDPRAVVCIREKSDSPLRFGYLHVLKASGQLGGRSALADDGSPLIIVEGMSDTAAAYDLGYQAVGRPSNLACLSDLVDLIRGYTGPVWVIGENDEKVDGRYPGKEGMETTFQRIRGVCKSIRMVMPPPHIKDLRAWKVNHGLTKALLDAYVETSGTEHVENVIIPDDRPLTVAREFLKDNYKLGDKFILKRWANNWFKYQDGRYVTIDKEAFDAPLWQWSQGKSLNIIKDNGSIVTRTVHATRSNVDNWERALASEVLVTNMRVPCWINGGKGPDPRDLIVFANGILDVPRFLSGIQSCLLDPTPDLFTTAALPFDFDPEVKCDAWLNFLLTSLGDDPAKISLLQEWVGYCMTTDTTMQKMLFMRGPSASGKGTILNTLTALVGPSQTAASNFTELSGPFGLQPLVGKSLCTIGDARTPKHGDMMRGLELLLNIVGNDNVSVNRKNKDQLDLTRLGCRVSIASNEFLDLPDHAGALMRRLLILEFKRSFVGQEDFNLEQKLRDEVQGIAVWALEGLRRLRQQGHFTIPQSTTEAMAEWRLATNPLAAFIEECCDLDGSLQKSELFDAWSSWSNERRIRPITKSRFFERMRFAVSTISSDTFEERGHKLSIYKGIKLKPWAARKLLGKPNG